MLDNLGEMGGLIDGGCGKGKESGDSDRVRLIYLYIYVCPVLVATLRISL